MGRAVRTGQRVDDVTEHRGAARWQRWQPGKVNAGELEQAEPSRCDCLAVRSGHLGPERAQRASTPVGGSAAADREEQSLHSMGESCRDRLPEPARAARQGVRRGQCESTDGGELDDARSVGQQQPRRRHRRPLRTRHGHGVAHAAEHGSFEAVQRALSAVGKRKLDEGVLGPLRAATPRKRFRDLSSSGRRLEAVGRKDDGGMSAQGSARPVPLDITARAEWATVPPVAGSGGGAEGPG